MTAKTQIDDLKTILSDRLLPEQKLWLALIDLLIGDAAEEPRASSSEYSNSRDLLIAQAREWLSGDSRDFYEVCDLAGINPHYLKANKDRFIEQKSSRLKRRRKRFSFTAMPVISEGAHVQ